MGHGAIFFIASFRSPEIPFKSTPMPPWLKPVSSRLSRFTQSLALITKRKALTLVTAGSPCPGTEVRTNGDRINGLFHLLINGISWGYNPLTNLISTSWDIQVGKGEMADFIRLFPFHISWFSWSGSRTGSELSEQFSHLLTAFSDCPNQLISCGCPMQGVIPSLSLASILALPLRNASATLRNTSATFSRPFSAAQCKGVFPSSSLAFALEGRFSHLSHLLMAIEGALQGIDIGSGLEKRFNHLIMAIVGWGSPSTRSRHRGHGLGLNVAPALRSMSTTFSWPLEAAQPKGGVTPCLLPLRLAPLLRSASATFSWPL